MAIDHWMACHRCKRKVKVRWRDEVLNSDQIRAFMMSHIEHHCSLTCAADIVRNYDDLDDDADMMVSQSERQMILDARKKGK